MAGGAETSRVRAAGKTCLFALILVQGCTRPNPAFGEFDEVGDGSDTVTPFDLPTTCTDRIDPGFELAVTVRAEENGPPIEGCGDAIFETTGFVTDEGNGRWSVAPCVTPNCFPGCEIGEPVFIDFDVPAPFQPTPAGPTTCTEIKVHHHDPVVGESICDFKAVSVTVESDPTFMAVSGSLEGVDSLAGLEAEAELVDGLECTCGDQDRFEPGLYSLAFLGTQPPIELTQFDTPAMAQFDGTNFAFAVTQSAGDEDCGARPRFDWMVAAP